jgi:peptide deformylase
MTCYPAPVITSVAKPIDKIDDNILLLVDKMTDIMIKNKGIGLAGPQVGVSLRIFIVSLDISRQNLKVYINPTANPYGGLEALEEGCLSLPVVTAKIKRYKKCSVTATDLHGNKFTEEAEGLLARVFQHEFDHLQGITIADRMGQVAKIGARKQLKELERSCRQD